jgi:hypothetical protein
MVEVGIAEYFSIGEALGIIGTMFIVLYFSRKQMQSLSVDIETKVLDGLDERIHGITQTMVERPELTKLISLLDQTDHRRWHSLTVFYTPLYMFSICAKEK